MSDSYFYMLSLMLLQSIINNSHYVVDSDLDELEMAQK